MKRVVDTSAWIEWLRKSATGEKVSVELPSPENWLVPTIVQLELAKWCQRELSEDVANEIIAFSTECVVVDLDTRLALNAAELATRHKLAMADAIVYATALVHDADVLTCDAHFEGLARVVLLAKVS